MPDAPLPPVAALLELELLLPPHASRIIAATPAAPPVSAVRRVLASRGPYVRDHIMRGQTETRDALIRAAAQCCPAPPAPARRSCRHATACRRSSAAAG